MNYKATSNQKKDLQLVPITLKIFTLSLQFTFSYIWMYVSDQGAPCPFTCLHGKANARIKSANPLKT